MASLSWWSAPVKISRKVSERHRWLLLSLHICPHISINCALKHLKRNCCCCWWSGPSLCTSLVASSERKKHSRRCQEKQVDKSRLQVLKLAFSSELSFEWTDTGRSGGKAQAKLSVFQNRGKRVHLVPLKLQTDLMGFRKTSCISLQQLSVHRPQSHSLLWASRIPTEVSGAAGTLAIWETQSLLGNTLNSPCFVKCSFSMTF